MTRFGVVAATAVPALIAAGISFVPGVPAGIAVGAVIALPLLVVGAIFVVLGLGSLERPLAGGITRSLGGASAAFILRIGGAIAAAVALGQDQPARAAIATIAACLMAGTIVETALLLRALRRAVPPTGAIHA